MIYINNNHVLTKEDEKNESSSFRNFLGRNMRKANAKLLAIDPIQNFLLGQIS